MINHEKKSFIKYLKNGDINNIEINYTNIMNKMFDTQLLNDYEIMKNKVDIYALVIHSTNQDYTIFPNKDDNYKGGMEQIADVYFAPFNNEDSTFVLTSNLKERIQDAINKGEKHGLFILATCNQSEKYSEIRFRPREAEGDYDEKSKTIYITTGSYDINGIYPPPSIPEIEIRPPRKNVRGGKKSVK